MSIIIQTTRTTVLKRDKVCRLCGSDVNLTLHHIKPRRDRGGNESSNLAVLCKLCHMQWHKTEKNKIGLCFFDWLAGGERRGNAYRRAQILKEMVVCRMTGISYPKLCRQLNEADLLTDSGKPWQPENARLWLQRRAPRLSERKNWRLVKWPYFAEDIERGLWR